MLGRPIPKKPRRGIIGKTYYITGRISQQERDKVTYFNLKYGYNDTNFVRVAIQRLIEDFESEEVEDEES